MAYNKNNKCFDCGKIITDYAERCVICSGKKFSTIDKTKPYSQYKECIDCGEIIKGHKKSIRCKKCWLEFAKGENHPNYNTDITDEERYFKRITSFKHKEWSLKVKQKDEFICQMCGTRKSPFNSHHIYSWSTNKELRYDIDNGICLCEKCHKQFHKDYGRKNNTMEQFKEFQIGGGRD